ncbi:MAG TPA: hypothetical protein VG714_06805 [Acidobacteriaceae bacterium]|nr:hypothetical protein [Acidobacteriaceae bacterium]
MPEEIAGAAQAGSNCLVGSNEYLLTIPGVARYHVRDGAQVRVQIEPGAAMGNVRVYLLGSVFGVLCHQNGLLPLHASAVERNGEVTAFLGNSGDGKSTLAACLRQRGHRVVSDDICLLEPQDDAMRVIPVAEWLKLWTQSLDHLGEKANEKFRVSESADKFRLYLSGEVSANAHLRRIVLLGCSESSTAAPTLEPLSILEAVAALFEMTYASYVPVLSGQKARVFQQCARALGQASAWRLDRPWDLDRMDETLDLLERQVLG